jgi:cell wall assembly regulator SMI1
MSIDAEVRKVVEILAGSEFEGCFQPPATINQISALENKTGILVSGGLRELWLLTNGAQYRRYGTPAFGVYTDEPTPCGFLSTEQSVEAWQELVQWSIANFEQGTPRDTRIKSGWANPKWLPFATFNGYGTVVFYDTDPNKGGQTGQIIAYQHDPDAIYLVANSFDEFFEKSNELLTTDASLIEWINKTR